MTPYALAGCTVALAAPVMVGHAPGHHWFPTLHPFDSQRVVCEVVLADDKAQGQWPGALYLSDDGGGSWRRGIDIASYGPVSTLRGPNERLLMPYEQWPLAPGDQRNMTAAGTILRWTGEGKVTAEPVPVRLLDFPRDLAPYRGDGLCMLTNGNILPLRDGRLFTTVYGMFAGEAKYSLPAMASDDGGLTWRFLSIAADHTMTADAPEGPCESQTARLADGRLLCIYRVGSGREHQYHKSLSADEGRTWTASEPVAGAWSVEPQLVRLGNGLLVLSGGRPGLFVWVCTDGEGTAWQAVNLAEHHNTFVTEPAVQYTAAVETTSYTGMVAVGPDEVLICYDRLAKGWEGGPGAKGELDTVFCVRGRITRD